MKSTTAAGLADAIAQLPKAAAGYVCLHEHSAQHGHLLFRGPFQGQEVVWECHIWPLLHADAIQQNATQHQYIDVHAEQTALAHRIDIGLNVSEITPSTLLKTMIMVRQYRNLAPGRHQWK